MAFDPGSVVTLKSGGQPMTVVETCEEGVKCVWIGEEGDFFSATIPDVALEDWDARSVDDEGDEDEGEESEGTASQSPAASQPTTATEPTAAAQPVAASELTADGQPAIASHTADLEALPMERRENAA